MARKSLLEKPLPRCKAPIAIRSSEDPARVRKMIGRLFPRSKYRRGLSLLSALTGMPDDGDVIVQDAGRYEPKFGDDLPFEADGLRLLIFHPKIEKCACYVGIDLQGKRFVRKEIIRLTSGERGSGFGTEVFAKQVDAALSLGFDYFSMHAARGETMHGYAIWPKLGFDMSLDDDSIPEEDRSVYCEAKRRFPKAKTVLDIVHTKEGETWWCEKKRKGRWIPGNGTDMLNARFELHPNSRSIEALRRYLLNKRGKRTGNTTSNPTSTTKRLQ